LLNLGLAGTLIGGCAEREHGSVEALKVASVVLAMNAEQPQEGGEEEHSGGQGGDGEGGFDHDDI